MVLFQTGSCCKPNSSMITYISAFGSFYRPHFNSHFEAFIR